MEGFQFLHNVQVPCKSVQLCSGSVWCSFHVGCAAQSAAHEVCWLRSDGATGVALEPSQPCSESTTRDLHEQCTRLTLGAHGFPMLRVCMLGIFGICLFCFFVFLIMIWIGKKRFNIKLIQKKTTTVTTVFMNCLRQVYGSICDCLCVFIYLLLIETKNGRKQNAEEQRICLINFQIINFKS